LKKLAMTTSHKEPMKPQKIKDQGSESGPIKTINKAMATLGGCRLRVQYMAATDNGKANAMAHSGCGNPWAHSNPMIKLRVLPNTAGQGCDIGPAGIANTSSADAPKGANSPKRAPCQCSKPVNKRQNRAINTMAKPQAKATRRRSRVETSMGGGIRALSRRRKRLRQLRST
jgi:hypothetical protein